MKLTYKHTLIAAYTGYITQAIVNNLPPLLFTAFCRDFGITLTELSALISINFITQLLVDTAAVKLVDRVGIRAAAVFAHIAAALGLVLMGILPFELPSFAGLAAAMIICAVGGGLNEVIISPVVEALPGDEKASAMSLLHSFYCWGQMGVVLLSTVFFVTIGSESWRFLPFVWALIPFANIFLFANVPIAHLNEEEGTSMGTRQLLKTRLFPLLLLLMVCSGASELAMSQWSSYFAETGLRVSKTAGDLLGPCGFALLMGSARLLYGIKGAGIRLERILALSCGLCIASYMTASFSPFPVLSLIGCALCGLSVGMMWPGTFSIAAREIPKGGNSMYALLALAGDLGCASGPAVVGFVSDATGVFTEGIITAAVFPVIMLMGMIYFMAIAKKRI